MLIIVTVSVFLSGSDVPKGKQNKAMPKCCARARAMALMAQQQGSQSEERGDKQGNCGNSNTPKGVKVTENCPCHKSCGSDKIEDPKCGRYCDTNKCKCKPDPCPTT